jgi:putative flippase GtrA
LGWYLARVFSFLAAATTTWWFNWRYTFATEDPAGQADARRDSVAVLPLSVAQRTAAVIQQYLHYLATMLVGGAVNYAVYALTLQWTQLPGAALLGVALGSVAGMGFNFLSARYWVFRP